MNINITATNPIYIIAITGTIIEDNVAILLTPPNIIIAVIIAKITPVIIGLTLYCVFNYSAIVFDCTVLKTNANVTVINTAKTTPNHFWLSPLVM